MAEAGVAAAVVVLGGGALYWVWKRRKRANGVIVAEAASVQGLVPVSTAATLLPSTADFLDQWEQQYTSNTKGDE